ncbi:MAG: ABC transporter permease, partial [Candidatus Hydrothermarchaeota archaeon]
MACALIIFAWHLLAIMLNSVALPSPLEVLFTFINQRSFLLPHLLISLIRVVCGIALAVSLAVPLGLLSYEDEIDKIVAPIVYLLYPIPHIVLLP